MGTPTVREGRREAGLRNSKWQTEDGKTQFSLLPSRRLVSETQEQGGKMPLCSL